MNRFRILLALAAGLVAGIAFGAEPARSLSGVPFAGTPAVEGALRLPAAAPARSIALGTPSATERSVKQKAAQVADKRAPLKIGFTREIPAGLQRIGLSSLDWQDVGAGTRAAHVVIDATSAAAVRAELSLQGDPTGLKFSFTGNGPGARVFGPYSWDELVSAGRWSPVLEGPVATLEIEAGPDASLVGTTLVIPRISHLEVSGAGLAPSRLKRDPRIGLAGSCNVDVACVTNPTTALLQASASVARIAFTGVGGTFLCTGSLLNSTDSAAQPTHIPYFATANHCIDSALTAATINFYWFFEAATCPSLADPNFTVTAGGAGLMYTNSDSDVTLLRLNANPPQGAFMAGWDANPVFPGEEIVSIHHPQGDLKKYSAGKAVGFGHYCLDADSFSGRCVEPEGTYITVHWTEGTTEPGSSGGGAYTIDSGGAYRLRGVLHGGGAACETPDDLDYFSRLDLAYSGISQYLAGVAQPSAGNHAIEYYNVNLDHYFMTASIAEAQSVESGGAGPGWVRTGEAFPVGSGDATVCRFYGSTQIDPVTMLRRGPNSHFYTADADECAQVQRDPGWTYEGPVLTIAVPTNGTCPSNTIPVYRLYNNGFANRPLDKGVRINSSNHRYTTNAERYRLMLLQPSYLSVYLGDERFGTDQVDSAATWSGESIVMCAPVLPP